MFAQLIHESVLNVLVPGDVKEYYSRFIAGRPVDFNYVYFMKNKQSREHFKTYVAVYLVLIRAGEVLLIRRFNTGYRDGMYSLVAGHLEGGETAEQCIVREAGEEAGINLLPEDLRVKHVMHRRAKDREYLDIYVTATNWNGTIQNMEPHKCDDLSWFSLDSLPENTIDEVVFALKNMEQGVFYSNFGWH